MPFHVPPLSRRQFLSGSLAAGAVLVAGRWLPAAEVKRDPNTWALLSDTHLWEKKDEIVNKVNMAKNLEAVRAEILTLEQLPGQLLINGDVAYKTGELPDYRLIAEMLQPFSEAGIPLHLTLGNHDHRENFWEVLKNQRTDKPPVENKHLSVVKGELANWFLLDSLEETDKTPGLLGKTQLEWLAKALDAHADKPAIIVSHHNPTGIGGTSPGIADSDALFEVLVPRKQVKLLFFGHTHNWNASEKEGIHCVNLPTTAYVFNEKQPIGWVKFKLAADGGTLELRAIEAKHPAHGEKKELKWRT